MLRTPVALLLLLAACSAEGTMDATGGPFRVQQVIVTKTQGNSTEQRRVSASYAEDGTLQGFRQEYVDGELILHGTLAYTDGQLEGVAITFRNLEMIVQAYAYDGDRLVGDTYSRAGQVQYTSTYGTHAADPARLTDAVADFGEGPGSPTRFLYDDELRVVAGERGTLREDFLYDAGRLVAVDATDDAYDLHYEYDGNRVIAVDGQGRQVDVTYDASGRIDTVTSVSESGTVTYVYRYEPLEAGGARILPIALGHFDFTGAALGYEPAPSTVVGDFGALY